MQHPAFGVGNARDRDVWRTVCEAGLSDFMNGWPSASIKRRAARHAPTAKPKAGPSCPQCSRVRSSNYGSFSDSHSSLQFVVVHRRRRSRRNSVAAAAAALTVIMFL